MRLIVTWSFLFFFFLFSFLFSPWLCFTLTSQSIPFFNLAHERLSGSSWGLRGMSPRCELDTSWPQTVQSAFKNHYWTSGSNFRLISDFRLALQWPPGCHAFQAALKTSQAVSSISVHKNLYMTQYGSIWVRRRNTAICQVLEDDRWFLQCLCSEWMYPELVLGSHKQDLFNLWRPAEQVPKTCHQNQLLVSDTKRCHMLSNPKHNSESRTSSVHEP